MLFRSLVGSALVKNRTESGLGKETLEFKKHHMMPAERSDQSLGDNVFDGFNEQDIENMMNNYLDGIHLKTLALNLPDGNVVIYHYEKNQDEYDKIVKEVKQATTAVVPAQKSPRRL